MWRKICQVVDSPISYFLYSQHIWANTQDSSSQMRHFLLIDVLARWVIPTPYLKEILYIPCHDLETKKPASFNHSLVSLKRYFGWLTETGRIKRDPSEGGEVR